MRKIKIVLYLVICFGNISASGQITRETGSINELLRSVETHNTELKAFSQHMQAQKTENKLSNNLPDPTVSYSHLWGADNSSETIGELIVSQSMDFPTLYHTRRQLNRQKNVMADHEYQLKRREILLKAQEICFDIILLREEQLLLKERHQNASELATLYQQRIESGDANVIELNKVKLELLNAKTEASINETNLKKKEEELIILNGNTPFQTEQLTYPAIVLPTDYAEIKDDVLNGELALAALEQESRVGHNLLKVAQESWLPKLEIGYRRNTESGAPFNGFVVGFSVPLFENKGKVKMARQQLLSTELSKEQVKSETAYNALQNFREAQKTKLLMDEYASLFKEHSDLLILKEALKSGQISLIEYFSEAAIIYQSQLNYLQLENKYHKTVASLFKNKL
ncbi:TolC family protein [Bacteroides graminisolvens]|uniref:TolC family protein n=1 Tax=Bacteroides graminisolvens TaxID=477666 RepID=UPI0024099DF2|nr:TolC family protein [Bacteroides graminisolvens]